MADDTPRPIHDYAIIGDCLSAALVSRGGSIDWLCWPRFDSEALFAAILDANAGCWSIAPPVRGRHERPRDDLRDAVRNPGPDRSHAGRLGRREARAPPSGSPDPSSP